MAKFADPELNIFRKIRIGNHRYINRKINDLVMIDRNFQLGLILSSVVFPRLFQNACLLFR